MAAWRTCTFMPILSLHLMTLTTYEKMLPQEMKIDTGAVSKNETIEYRMLMSLQNRKKGQRKERGNTLPKN